MDSVQRVSNVVREKINVSPIVNTSEEKQKNLDIPDRRGMMPKYLGHDIILNNMLEEFFH